MENLGRILVVEDERIVARDIQMNLRRLGYVALEAAASADEAVTIAHEHHPDLVLMDIRIEGMVDGVDAARMLRERFDVPVIFLTAFADGPTLQRARETEPYGYLLKPVRPDELRTTVEIALHKHRVDRGVRARERWFSTTLRSIADAIVSVDNDNRVTYMNPAAEALTGTSLEFAKGRISSEVLDLLGLDQQPMTPSPIEAALHGKQTVWMHEGLLRRSATHDVRRVSDSAAVVTTDDGIAGAVMVFRDTTDQHALQARLAMADRLASVGLLAAGMAHEINNPLAAALLSLEMATGSTSTLDQQLPGASSVADLARSLQIATNACLHVRSIVRGLRLFSRGDDGEPHPVDIPAVIDTTLQLARAELRHRAKVIQVNEPTPRVRGTESRLAQVVLNIVVNAAQAIPEGNADENEVRITATTDEAGWAVIEVADTGVGMNSDTLSKLFTPFFTTKVTGMGTGLGLILSRTIVEELDGCLRIESSPGKGTVVRVLLPPYDSTSLVPAPPQQSAVTSPTARARVLVVDDDALMRNAIIRALRDSHDVHVAASGSEALERVRAGERFDLLLCDMMMPTMTGMDLHAALRAIDPKLADDVIFMTGGVFNPAVQTFLQHVGNVRIEKPFSRASLLQTLDDFIARRNV